MQGTAREHQTALVYLPGVCMYMHRSPRCSRHWIHECNRSSSHGYGTSIYLAFETDGFERVCMHVCTYVSDRYLRVARTRSPPPRGAHALVNSLGQCVQVAESSLLSRSLIPSPSSDIVCRPARPNCYPMYPPHLRRVLFSFSLPDVCILHMHPVNAHNTYTHTWGLLKTV